MTGAAFHHPLLMLLLKRTMHTLVGSKVVAAVRHVPLVFIHNMVDKSTPYLLQITKEKIKIMVQHLIKYRINISLT